MALNQLVSKKSNLLYRKLVIRKRRQTIVHHWKNIYFILCCWFKWSKYYLSVYYTTMLDYYYYSFQQNQYSIYYHWKVYMEMGPDFYDKTQQIFDKNLLFKTMEWWNTVIFSNPLILSGWNRQLWSLSKGLMVHLWILYRWLSQNVTKSI